MATDSFTPSQLKRGPESSVMEGRNMKKPRQGGRFDSTGLSGIDPMHGRVASPSMAFARLRKGEPRTRRACWRASRFCVHHASDTGCNEPYHYPMRFSHASAV